MSDTPKTDKEAMWADAGTGGQFQCIHIDEARAMESLLRETKEALENCFNCGFGNAPIRAARVKIDEYLNS